MILQAQGQDVQNDGDKAGLPTKRKKPPIKRLQHTIEDQVMNSYHIKWENFAFKFYILGL